LAGNSNSFENFFAATDFKNIKDDYRGKFAEILEKVLIAVSNFGILECFRMIIKI
jgi:hypothetical protein